MRVNRQTKKATGSGETVDLAARGLDGLPPVKVRRGVPVEEQARDYVDGLGLPLGTRRGSVLHVVECAISERLPKEERPGWFQTDEEILASLDDRP